MESSNIESNYECDSVPLSDSFANKSFSSDWLKLKEFASNLQTKAQQFLPEKITDSMNSIISTVKKFELADESGIKAHFESAETEENHCNQSKNISFVNHVFNDLLSLPYVPDSLFRYITRQSLKTFVNQSIKLSAELSQDNQQKMIDTIKTLPIASEIPSEFDPRALSSSFYARFLGPQLHTFCAIFPSESTSLAEAELLSLELLCQRAEIGPKQRILDANCSWGALLLFAAPKFPCSEFVGLTDSENQRHFIMNQARIRKISNITVILADISQFTLKELTTQRKPWQNEVDSAGNIVESFSFPINSPLSHELPNNNIGEMDLLIKSGKKIANKGTQTVAGSQGEQDLLFDRVICLEMGEKIRNWQFLLRKLATFTKIGDNPGKLLLQLPVTKGISIVHDLTSANLAPTDGNFATNMLHQSLISHFLYNSSRNYWNSELFSYFQEEFTLLKQFHCSGQHYHRTISHWMENFELHKSQLAAKLVRVYGESEGERAVELLRKAWLLQSEVFKFSEGKQFFVAQYLMQVKS
jgi:cyclopropane fatty-acyl-phospholipid synthase-like methyltransferase